MTKKDDRNEYKLRVSLDASAIEDLEPDPTVKVVARDEKGGISSETVKLDVKGQGVATLALTKRPGALRVLVGPADASDEELAGLQTIRVDVSSRLWRDKAELSIGPVKISSYYWYWWRRWCRTFTIRGKVICPDGSPVPAAEVCAYDVDSWFIWSSKQLLDCATTDIDGTFEMKFRFCCGWWPWWWWKYRVWQIDPLLVDRVGTELQRFPDLNLARVGNQPSLEAFENLLVETGQRTAGALSPSDTVLLESVRKDLLAQLPKSPELERFRIWPWYPWRPWWDCTPDVIFKVTQDCLTPGAVVLEESISDTRWNIDNPLDVTLTVTEDACCRPNPCPEPPCEGGECLIIDLVCGNSVDNIGGNLGAALTPEGYLYPGGATPGTTQYNGDRPFAGIVPIGKNPGDLLAVDYYEIEYSSNGGVTWNPLPTGAGVDFRRQFLETATFTTDYASFPHDSASFPGHTVYETREHFEGASGKTYDFPGADRWWLSLNWGMLIPLDSRQLPGGDGTYHFRVVGYQDGGGGTLVNRRVLPICGTQTDNGAVLTFDNRVAPPDPAHPTGPGHECGSGTVHTCTTEPDTDIISIKVNGNLVGPCEVVDTTTGTLEVEFLAHDPDDHLALYSLTAHYGDSLVQNLLRQPGSVITPLSAAHAGPTYGEALAQGATAPHWQTGTFRLEVPLSEAFPEPCCYLLRLRAWKRTVVGGKSGERFSCDQGYSYRNRSEFTIGVGVCPPNEP